MTGKTCIAGLGTEGMTLNPIKGKAPVLTFINPRDVTIDPGYQREIMRRQRDSIADKIVNFDFDLFDPVKLAWTEDGLEVIDGQCRLIAAASRPDVIEVPAIIVEAPERRDRAGLFVGANANRMSVTPNQIHRAAVLAGDDAALAIDTACQRAGVHILPFTPPFGTAYAVGDTTALAAIKGLLRRRGPDGAHIVLASLVAAELAPILSDHIKASEALVFDEAYAGEMDGERLTATLRVIGPKLQTEAKEIAAAKCLPMWRAMTATLFKNRAKRPAKPVLVAVTAHAEPHASSVRLHSRPAFEPAGFNHGDPPPGRSALDRRRAAS